MVTSHGMGACQAPDRLMEVGHVGMGNESRLGVSWGCAGTTLSAGKMASRKVGSPGPGKEVFCEHSGPQGCHYYQEQQRAGFWTGPEVWGAWYPG